ncbi:MAG: hypothetical protein C7B43_18420 [Sulfobacillus benefaciens]|uniref:Uncharacterized protein n=1 Tax=Sulfobacillus benefaciens TaxID=453960 RepID=A0A2T2WR18_9FIRM|nr:MAG: hypothetical protein C7B43_18420 [Sulfobacillus benefaciens]
MAAKLRPEVVRIVATTTAELAPIIFRKFFIIKFLPIYDWFGITMTTISVSYLQCKKIMSTMEKCAKIILFTQEFPDIHPPF